MPNLSIKDVPEAWAEALRQRAARNHRSLQGELMLILERAAAEVGADTKAPSPVADAGLEADGKAVLRRGAKTIEQVFADHLDRFPRPIEGVGSVDLIRQARDAR